MFRAPGHAGLPTFQTLLDDVPAPLAVTARHLGISVNTLRRYKRENSAPRAIMLAVFWESRWGISAIDADAFNSVTVYRAETQGLKRQVNRMAGIIWRLENEREIYQDMPANSPFYMTV